MDPAQREAKTLLDATRAPMPGLSATVPVLFDVWGRPIAAEGGAGPDMLSPSRVLTARNDPVNLAVLDADAHSGKPARIEMGEPTYARYQTAAAGRSSGLGSSSGCRAMQEG